LLFSKDYSQTFQKSNKKSRQQNPEKIRIITKKCFLVRIAAGKI